MQFDKLLNDYESKINVTWKDKNDLLKNVKANKETRKRAIKAINDIKKIREKEATKEKRKLEDDSLLKKKKEKMVNLLILLFMYKNWQVWSVLFW